MDRFFDWLRGSAPGLVPLALFVGAGAGAGAVLFRYLIFWCTELFTGTNQYGGDGHVANPNLPFLGIFFVILVPIVGGLIYGPMIDRFAKEARGHGVPEVMLAIAERGGRIGPAVAVVKSLASAICIGVGGSVGREGPIVQIGSALGSTIGQRLRLPETRLRLMVACGAAGGISATFNAPIAGVFFGLELILRDFQTEAFGVVVLSSVTADVIGRAAFGTHPLFDLPSFHLASGFDYLLYALLGLLAAVVGVAFIRVLYGFEDFFDKYWPGPDWARPATGGALLGLLLLALPQMYGVGYPVMQNGIVGKYVIWFLLLLLVGKLIAVSLTIAIGGSGGVFAPSLFMGAMLGAAFGEVAHSIAPGIAGGPGAYAIIGMGAVFAGAARAPITAVIIIFELTGDYTIILPVMAAIVLAAGLSNLLSDDTIYTLKLRRRGIDIMRGRAANLMEILTVADAMAPVPAAVPQGLPLNEVIARLADEDRDALPVVDDDGHYRGTVTSSQVERSARENLLDTTAGELATTGAALRVDQTLEAALGQLVAHERSGLPVLSIENTRILGWLNHRDVLRAYNQRLGASVDQSEKSTHSDHDGETGPLYGPEMITAQRPLAKLQGYQILDVKLTKDGPPVGQRVADTSWPPSSVLLAIRREGGESATAEEDTVLRKGDRLSLLVPSDKAGEIGEIVNGLTRGRRKEKAPAAVGRDENAPEPGPNGAGPAE